MVRPVECCEEGPGFSHNLMNLSQKKGFCLDDITTNHLENNPCICVHVCVFVCAHIHSMHVCLLAYFIGLACVWL